MTHHDDELLSAIIDGDAIAVADRTHVETCDQCRDRLAALRSAAALVATAVPPPPAAARRHAITAALDAQLTPPRRAGAVAPVRSGAAALGPRLRWARWSRPLLAAATAVVALVVAVPLVDGENGDGGGVAMTARDAGPVVAGDLGELEDGAALADRVRAELGGTAADDGIGATTGDAGGPDASESVGAPRSDAMTAATPAAAEASRCEAVLRASADLGALRYVATARWEGTAAVVLGFGTGGENGSADSDGGPVWVYVLAVDDCRVLNWQRA